jgi:hypothetical protein
VAEVRRYSGNNARNSVAGPVPQPVFGCPGLLQFVRFEEWLEVNEKKPGPESSSNLPFLDLLGNCAASLPLGGLNRGMTEFGERNVCSRPGIGEANSTYLKPEA